MPKILISKVLYARLSRIRPTTRVGENRAFVSAPKFSEIILDFIKKLMLIFGFCEVPWTNYWQDVLQTELLVSPCFGLFILRVKIAYLDIESELANHHFVNILAFESAIQVLNGLIANVCNPAPVVKILRVRCVTHETNFLNAINCDWFAWCGSLLWLNYYHCWMMSASLNHCKKMGAEPGRRFPKQPAAKLESVIVVYVYW